jgi:succinoglycan biosynthesis protein ExoA
MKRTTFLTNGGMRSFPSRVAEDADFYYRLRQAGGRVMVDPAIVSAYQPRTSLGGLWQQFFRYGMGKADMFYVNGEFPSWRPLAPLALLVGIAAAIVVGALVGNWWVLGIVAAAWIVAIIIGAKGNILTAVAIAAMHASYGLGLLRGLIRSPRTVRSQVG